MHSPYLVHGIARPGDVVLTMSGQLHSRLIDATTGKRGYSHAALVLDSGRLLEARVGGTGAYVMRTQSVHTSEAPTEFQILAELPFKPTKALLLRHPALEGREETEIRDCLQGLLSRVNGLDYSEYHRPLHAADIPDLVRLVATLPLRTYESTLAERHLRGPFCSELVGEFFRMLGLTLHASEREPEAVSPNDLHPMVSLLLEVPGGVLFVDPDDLTPADPYVQQMQEANLHMAKNVRATARRAHQLRSTVDSFNETSRDAAEKANRAHQYHSTRLMTSSTRLSRRAAASGIQSSITACEELSERLRAHVAMPNWTYLDPTGFHAVMSDLLAIESSLRTEADLLRARRIRASLRRGKVSRRRAFRKLRTVRHRLLRSRQQR